MTQEVVSDLRGPDPSELRVEIVRAGVRQYLVAKLVGVSEGQLSRILSGRAALSDEMAGRIRTAISEVAAR